MLDKQKNFHKICDLYSDFFSLLFTTTRHSNLRSYLYSITGLAVSAWKQDVVKQTVVLRPVAFIIGTDYTARYSKITACVARSTGIRVASQVDCYKMSIRIRKE